jgi:hypothetical protein
MKKTDGDLEQYCKHHACPVPGCYASKSSKVDGCPLHPSGAGCQAVEEYGGFDEVKTQPVAPAWKSAKPPAIAAGTTASNFTRKEMGPPQSSTAEEQFQDGFEDEAPPPPPPRKNAPAATETSFDGFEDDNSSGDEGAPPLPKKTTAASSGWIEGGKACGGGGDDDTLLLAQVLDELQLSVHSDGLKTQGINTAKQYIEANRKTRMAAGIKMGMISKIEKLLLKKAPELKPPETFDGFGGELV